MPRKTSRTSTEPKTIDTAPRRRKKTRGRKVPSKRSSTPDPDVLETQVKVWEAYERLRSTRAVAEELGVGHWVVRGVIHKDRARMVALLDGAMEAVVADWERAATQALRITGGALNIIEGLLTEIQVAAAEGRVTSIRNADGYQMPVLDAIHFLVVSRVLDQAAGTAAKGTQISLAYRSQGPLSDKLEGLKEGQSIADRVRSMGDLEIVKTIRAAGLQPPRVIEQRLKMIESKSRTLADKKTAGDATPAADGQEDSELTS